MDGEVGVVDLHTVQPWQRRRGHRPGDESMGALEERHGDKGDRGTIAVMCDGKRGGGEAEILCHC